MLSPRFLGFWEKLLVAFSERKAKQNRPQHLFRVIGMAYAMLAEGKTDYTDLKANNTVQNVMLAYKQKRM